MKSKTETPEIIALWKRIEYLRRQQSISKLALLVNYDIRWRTNLSFDVLCDMANVLNITVADLVDIENEPSELLDQSLHFVANAKGTSVNKLNQICKFLNEWRFD